MAANEKKVVVRFKDAQDRLVLQAADLSLETIAAMVEGKSIDLQPKYQRRERWSHEQQSALIESFLLNIPIPPIYLAEENFGIYSAIDGKQRISAIFQFMRGGLKLAGVETFKELEGSDFHSLPIDLQNALRIRPYVRAITLLKQSDPALKYEVFTRLNRQGVPLNPQEIRNVLYRGKLNDLVYRLAKNAFLKRQLKIKGTKASAYQNMDDAEHVLRFLALHLDRKSFAGSFRRAMDGFMDRHRNPSPSELTGFAQSFNEAIGACKRIWGDSAFKRANDGDWRDQFLSGMYDAQMLAVARLSSTQVAQAVARSGSILKRTEALFAEDREFDAAVRQATNTPSRLDYRVARITHLLTSN